MRPFWLSSFRLWTQYDFQESRTCMPKKLLVPLKLGIPSASEPEMKRLILIFVAYLLPFSKLPDWFCALAGGQQQPEEWEGEASTFHHQNTHHHAVQSKWTEKITSEALSNVIGSQLKCPKPWAWSQKLHCWLSPNNIQIKMRNRFQSPIFTHPIKWKKRLHNNYCYAWRFSLFYLRVIFYSISGGTQ